MAGDTLLTIGELARLTGLPVKTIRFWSDEGLVPPADRTPAGYRLYQPGALVRLGLIRTMRELGIGLAVIRQVLARELTICEVAEAHAAALEVQIRSLRLHQSVLRTVAGRGTATSEEIQLMHKLAQLSAAQRRQLITEFIDETFAGLDVAPGFVSMMRSAMPDLPDEPAQDQVAAWVELAELVQDPGFRGSLRRSAAAQARARAETPAEPSREAHQAMAALLRERAAAASAAGIEPGSPAARPVTDEIVAAYAGHCGRANGPAFRAWLLDQLEAGSDARYERYWQLLGIINGWPVQPSITPAAEWLITALRSA
ncbi:MAG: MerR family transcriptional regulator [Nocardiopsaceae bacterium]|jgi:DNA-binding transcriptional MerR regulator|nr:MerR family transcriptional regulator [Nocardiopsaceae bacterium]